MGLCSYSKRRIKMSEKQGVKRNERHTRALRRQQKEYWGGSLHSGSIYYALQSSVKKPDKSVQEAVQQRLER